MKENLESQIKNYGKPDKEILKGIKKLANYTYEADGTKPIIVLAPKLGNSKPGEESKKLRVYTYGGLIGEIPTSHRQQASLFKDKNYPKYLAHDSKKKSRLEELLLLSNSKTQVLRTLFDDEYLKLAIEACRNRYTKEMGDPKERVIETNLVKQYLGNTDAWIPFDIEFSTPQNWGDEERGTSDIILYDKRNNTFYLIELKYNNKSCIGKSGLLAHYNKVTKIIKESRDNLVKEFYRKLDFLCEYEIINSEAWKEVLKSTDREKIKLKFGYFFIGGKVEKYVKDVKEELKDTDKDCSFLYSPDIDTDILKNCQMLSYDEFMRYKE